jgi:hypothetical protein
MGSTWRTQNTDANLPIPITVAKDLLQRCVELILALPRNVFLIFPLISNLHTVRCDGWDVCWDVWKAAAAANRNNHDYAEYNKPESSR